MKRGWTRIALAGAFMAMAALAFAVPVHHVHMLQLGLGVPAEIEQAEPEAHDPAPHRHAGHQHGDTGHGDHHAHAPAADPADGDAEVDHSDHQMPRCPVCSLANAVAATEPPVQPSLSARAPRRAMVPVADATELPARHHFRPVQPRAPPIAV